MTQEPKMTRLSASRYVGITSKRMRELEGAGLIKYINIPTKKGRRIILHQKNWLDKFLRTYSEKAV